MVINVSIMMVNNRCEKCGGRKLRKGEVLCNPCFCDYLERKVKSTIRRHHMLERGDNVAVSLSGGKDSSTALYMMTPVVRRMGGTVSAIFVDEGIKGYRDKAKENAMKLCGKLSVPLHVVDFKDEFGITLDEVMRRTKTKNICSYCGVLRRRLLGKVAEELKATKLVMAHNLDDEAQTTLMNVLRGEVRRIGRTRNRMAMKRIKPLRECTESETMRYAKIKGLVSPFYKKGCPYMAYAYRVDVRRFLDEMENKHPGTKMAVLKSHDELAGVLAKEEKKKKRTTCELCGSPSSGKMCKACEVLGEISDGRKGGR